MTAETTATYVTAVIGCMARKAVRRLAAFLRFWLEIMLAVVNGFLAMLLVMALCLWLRMPGASAEEIIHLPVATVAVEADSHLNIRKTPGGELTVHRLYAWEDVVILAQDGDWALVIRPEHVECTDLNGTPLGWAHMDYLLVYRQYIKKGPWLQPWAGMNPDQIDQQQYIILEAFWQ